MIWVDGQLTDNMPVCDRGLAYGDGFFTTMLVLEGRLINWRKHQQRLTLSALCLGFPELNWPALTQDLTTVLNHFVATDTGVIKIIITRGCGGAGYQPLPKAQTQPRIIIQKLPYPQQVDRSLKDAKNNPACLSFIVKSQVCRTLWSDNKQLAGLKHLNRLDNVLARYELADGMSEGIMLSQTGGVISGTQSNIVVLKDLIAYTPKLETCGIHGTLLASLKEWLPSLGYDWQETQFDLAFLNSADEVFFCNAVRGIMPMESLNGKAWPVHKSLKLQSQLLPYLIQQSTENIC